jgi:hypothetical protein
MADRRVQMELVDATPLLQSVIDDAASKETVEGIDLVTSIHSVIANVAIGAFQAGVMTMAKSSSYYENPRDLADRLAFRAELSGYKLKMVDSFALHPEEVAPLFHTAPSYIPFDRSKCEPEGGFTNADRANWESMTRNMVADFKVSSLDSWRAVAAEMSYRYGKYLKSQGKEGEDMLNMVRAFEIKQLAIIRESTISESLRQPDQDDHAHEHYLEDLWRARQTIWEALPSSGQTRR